MFFGKGTGSDPTASQIMQAEQNTFAVEGAVGDDADFDDLIVRVEAMQVFHADEIVDANNTANAFNTGVNEGLFAEVTSFNYISGGQGLR